MEYLYLVTDAAELSSYQQFVKSIDKKVEEYLAFLKEHYAVIEPPRAVCWTSSRAAVSLISDIPLPAYTNDCRVVITPDESAWRALYLSALAPLKGSKEYELLKHYYNRQISKNWILQILGHELVHHSDWFLDEYQNPLQSGAWFEEGMAEYISRRYFLSEKEYQQRCDWDRWAVKQLWNQCGGQPLERFDLAACGQDMTAVLFYYWRCFLTIHDLAVSFDTDELFRRYRDWSIKQEGSLSSFFTRFFHSLR